jgi:hypothetical protein
MPEGKVPVSEIVGDGEPTAVRLNDPAVPTVKLAVFALVNTGD